MVETGDMAVINGRLCRVVSIDNASAEVVWIDLEGRVEQRTAPLAALALLRDVLLPRSLWPDAGDLDQRTAEAEEHAAAAERAKRNRAARKAKKSKKIKRRDAA